MSYNTELQSNNADLQAILDMINALPDMGESGSGLPDPIVAGDTPVLASFVSKEIYGTSYSATGLSITIPKDGTYRFKFNCAAENDSGTRGSQLRKNGTTVYTNTQWSAGDGYLQTNSYDLACAAGDVITVYMRSSSSLYTVNCLALVACIDWDIDWNGSSGGGKKTVNVTITSSGPAPCIYFAEDGTKKEVSYSTITDDILFGVLVVNASSTSNVTVTGEYYVIEAGYKKIYYFLNDGSTIKVTASSGGAD